MKVMAWNVAGLRGLLKKDDGAALKKLVEAEQPDILCLQEHKLQDSHTTEVEAQVKALLPSYGSCHWAVSTAKKGYSGVVTIVKEVAGLGPPRVSYGLGTHGFTDEGRIITLEYEHFHLIFSYSPNSGEGLKRIDHRIDEFEPALRSYLQDLDSRKPVVLLGDLNVAHLDADIWNVTAKHIPKSAGTTPQERAAFGQLLETCKMADAFRHFHPEATGCFTYWSMRAGNKPVNRGLRLDYCAASSRIMPPLVGDGGGVTEVEVCDAFMVEAEASDHCPVGITLAINN